MDLDAVRFGYYSNGKSVIAALNANPSLPLRQLIDEIPDDPGRRALRTMLVNALVAWAAASYYERVWASWDYLDAFLNGDIPAAAAALPNVGKGSLRLLREALAIIKPSNGSSALAFWGDNDQEPGPLPEVCCPHCGANLLLRS